MLLTFLKGFGTGGGLIIAIGAQNAFVLSQGVKKHHYIIIPLICATCDALLIGIGVTGVGSMIAASRPLALGAGIGGALFLLFYGLRSFVSAIRGGALKEGGDSPGSFKNAVAATLAVTLLNPHVYLDTVILLGSLAGQFQPPGHLVFGAGAALASFIWFFSLSLGGKLLAPLFTREWSWRILDSLVGMVMWAIALSIIRGLITP